MFDHLKSIFDPIKKGTQITTPKTCTLANISQPKARKLWLPNIKTNKDMNVLSTQE